MRDSYNGITLAFQANDEGSIPLSRSKFKAEKNINYNKNIVDKFKKVSDNIIL